MYLINVHTLELEDFIGRAVPPYAALSHRWGREELTFKEVSKKRVDTQTPKEGFTKMVSACRIALECHGVDYLWIDTCCIDKKSSAELSEAINSMYRWYQESQVCIVYLQDVAHTQELPDAASTDPEPDSHRVDSPVESKVDPTEKLVPFEKSSWFSRAWTFQELLAPSDVRFYDYSWTLLGTKGSLLHSIVEATKIDSKVLTRQKKLKDYCIAEKMRWASHREATREEDIAYSLLGIFDVNMPLLYGEGKKAFTRLQEEIINRTSDHTFLFWGSGTESTQLLARSPADFANFSEGCDYRTDHKPTSLNNIGLEIDLSLGYWDWETYSIPYSTVYPEIDALLLRIDRETQTLHRIGNVRKHLSFMQRRREYGSRRVTLLRTPLFEDRISRRLETFGGFRIWENSVSCQPIMLAETKRQVLGLWEKDPVTGTDQCRFQDLTINHVARIECTIEQRHRLCVDLCFNFDFGPYVHVKNKNSTHERKDGNRHVTDILFLRDNKNLRWVSGDVHCRHVDIPGTGAGSGFKSRLYSIDHSFGPLADCGGFMMKMPDHLFDGPSPPNTFITMIPPMNWRFQSKNLCWVFAITVGLSKISRGMATLALDSN